MAACSFGGSYVRPQLGTSARTSVPWSSVHSARSVYLRRAGSLPDAMCVRKLAPAIKAFMPGELLRFVRLLLDTAKRMGGTG
jgi:hypothetical protein